MLPQMTTSCMKMRNKHYNFVFLGDEIFSVNGRSVAGLTHSEAIGIFKETKVGAIQVTLGRREASRKVASPPEADDAVQCWGNDWPLGFSQARISTKQENKREMCVKNIQKSCNQHLQMTRLPRVRTKILQAAMLQSLHLSISLWSQPSIPSNEEISRICPLPFHYFITVKYVGGFVWNNPVIYVLLYPLWLWCIV